MATAKKFKPEKKFAAACGVGPAAPAADVARWCASAGAAYAEFTPDEQACLARKIPLLLSEGKPHDQAVAVAIAMCAPGKARQHAAAPVMPSPAPAAMPAPRTFRHAYRSEQLPSGNYAIRGLPIFAAPPGEAKGASYDEAWLRGACALAAERRGRGYLAPVHVEHHEPGADRENAGFLDNLAMAPCDVDGAMLPTIFADLVEVPPAVFAEIEAMRLPYRSVEILDPAVPEVGSLALMASDPPFFRFPVTVVSPPRRVAFHFRSDPGRPTMSVTTTQPEAPSPAAAAPAAPAAFAAPEGSKAEEAKETPAEEAAEQKEKKMAATELCPHCGQPMPAAHAPAVPAPHAEAGAAPPAVPRVPYDAGAAYDTLLAANAKLTARLEALERAAGERSDEERIERALTSFRAANKLADPAQFRAVVKDLGLRGEMVDRYAQHYGAALVAAPPRPGESALAVGGGSLDDPRAYLGRDEQLKKFAAEDPRTHRAAAESAAAFDASPRLQAEWKYGREAWVAAAVAGKKRDLGIRG